MAKKKKFKSQDKKEINESESNKPKITRITYHNKIRKPKIINSVPGSFLALLFTIIRGHSSSRPKPHNNNRRIYIQSRTRGLLSWGWQCILYYGQRLRTTPPFRRGFRISSWYCHSLTHQWDYPARQFTHQIYLDGACSKRRRFADLILRWTAYLHPPPVFSFILAVLAPPICSKRFHRTSRNSSFVISASFKIARKVPLAISLWSGIVSGLFVGCLKWMWLLFWSLT